MYSICEIIMTYLCFYCLLKIPNISITYNKIRVPWCNAGFLSQRPVFRCKVFHTGLFVDKAVLEQVLPSIIPLVLLIHIHSHTMNTSLAHWCTFFCPQKWSVDLQVIHNINTQNTFVCFKNHLFHCTKSLVLLAHFQKR
jgi:hypothetical protein